MEEPKGAFRTLSFHARRPCRRAFADPPVLDAPAPVASHASLILFTARRPPAASARRPDTILIINHYARSCAYDARNFVERDLDVLDPALVTLLRASGELPIAKLFSCPAVAAQSHPGPDDHHKVFQVATVDDGLTRQGTIFDIIYDLPDYLHTMDLYQFEGHVVPLPSHLGAQRTRSHRRAPDAFVTKLADHKQHFALRIECNSIVMVDDAAGVELFPGSKSSSGYATMAQNVVDLVASTGSTTVSPSDDQFFQMLQTRQRLDKSRLVRLQHEERTFHGSYKFLAGATPDERDRLNLEDPSEYALPASSGCCTLSGRRGHDAVAQRRVEDAQIQAQALERHPVRARRRALARQPPIRRLAALDELACVANLLVPDAIWRLLGIASPWTTSPGFQTLAASTSTTLVQQLGQNGFNEFAIHFCDMASVSKLWHLESSWWTMIQVYHLKFTPDALAQTVAPDAFVTERADHEQRFALQIGRNSIVTVGVELLRGVRVEVGLSRPTASSMLFPACRLPSAGTNRPLRLVEATSSWKISLPDLHDVKTPNFSTINHYAVLCVYDGHNLVEPDTDVDALFRVSGESFVEKLFSSPGLAADYAGANYLPSHSRAHSSRFFVPFVQTPAPTRPWCRTLAMSRARAARPCIPGMTSSPRRSSRVSVPTCATPASATARTGHGARHRDQLERHRHDVCAAIRVPPRPMDRAHFNDRGRSSGAQALTWGLNRS
ncbi:hypothetical protein EXIGLDRAFT_833021 [Exidia glandulosa HHB12029]|uniref:Uncharacterized protein n=1 Tax=Exidia glandulosa HHB12029 TaxID=1314781 RepID=A0A165L0A9_EXIGL|nr:hypothetical protein EXIGLDRAFT_833021 [Exidia glandulosa HHB12029]